MSNLRVGIPISENYSPGIDTKKRQGRNKQELLKDLEMLIKEIENEKHEINRENLEKKLKNIAELIAKY